MKIKKIAVTFLVGMMTITSFSGTIFGTTNVYADTVSTSQSVTKTATLNNVNISINGGKPIMVKAYNIDGYNYFRVRDICEPLNMKVMQVGDTNGVFINPEATYYGNGSAMPGLTEKTITVSLGKAGIGFGGMGKVDSDYFNYSGHNFFKVADIVAAANDNKNSMITTIKGFATRKGYIGKSPYSSVKNLSVVFDSNSNTITLKTNVTDLNQVFDTAKNGSSIISSTKIDNEVVSAKQPVQTSAPVVGSFPAKVLIDPSKGAYVDGDPAKGVLVNNYTSPYAVGTTGQCTWFAVGRLTELSGKKILNQSMVTTDPKNAQYMALTGATGTWVDKESKSNGDVLGAITDINKIQNDCIACWSNHVVFVEYVYRDSSGNPTYVYVTEANNNWGYTEGVYYPYLDGKVKKEAWHDFLQREGPDHPLLGYIYVK